MKLQTAMKAKTIMLGGIVLIAVACSQKTAPAAKAEKPAYDGPRVTYVTDIAPLMERSCAPCHYPAKDGTKEPLDTYEAVKHEHEEILYHVQLPKSHHEYMPYRGKKPGLTAEEVQLLKNWARGGFIES